MSNTIEPLVHDANKLVHEHMIDPVMDLMHETQTAALHGIQEARDMLTERASGTQEFLHRSCHQVSRWIAVHPFTSVGLALLAGAAMAVSSRKK